MEGLIPVICKTLKKNQIRRKYKCLSSSAAAQTYNISDFYPQGSRYHYSAPPQIEMKKNSVAAIGDLPAQAITNAHHRRHNSSVTDYSSGFSAAEDMVITKSNQLVRFGSNRFFSCVTGVCLKVKNVIQVQYH